MQCILRPHYTFKGKISYFSWVKGRADHPTHLTQQLMFQNRSPTLLPYPPNIMVSLFSFLASLKFHSIFLPVMLSNPILEMEINNMISYLKCKVF